MPSIFQSQPAHSVHTINIRSKTSLLQHPINDVTRDVLSRVQTRLCLISSAAQHSREKTRYQRQK